MKGEKQTFNTKIQDKIYCNQLVWETAQSSQLGLAISLTGQVWNFPLLHTFLSLPHSLTVVGQMQRVEQSGVDEVHLRDIYTLRETLKWEPVEERSNLKMEVIKK